MRNELSPVERKDEPLEAEVHSCGYGFSTNAHDLITEARGVPRLARMQVKMQALPNADMRKIAFFSIVASHTACMLMTAHPHPTDFVIRGDEWWELMTRYWGLKSFMLKDFVGERINGEACRVCDEYGFELFGKGLPGNAVGNRHDHIKWALVIAMQAMGVDINCVGGAGPLQAIRHPGSDEPHGEGRRLARVGSRLHDEIWQHVDLVAPQHHQYVKGALHRLPARPGGHGGRVRGRAKMPAEYIWKARDVDAKDNSTVTGTVGPMETALQGYGGVAALVAGHFGEIIKGFDKLLGDVAEIGVQQLQNALYTKTADQARAVLLWQLRRKMLAAICRANLNCMQGLMMHLGTSGATAQSHARRANARCYFFPHGDAANASYQYRSSHFNFSRDGGGGVHY
jgi:hypothetical protein